MQLLICNDESDCGRSDCMLSRDVMQIENSSVFSVFQVHFEVFIDGYGGGG